MNIKLIWQQNYVLCICISANGVLKFVLAGTFRQTFPAISREYKLSERQVCLSTLYDWSDIQEICLQTSAWV